jgi:uncharacterized Zn-binding protein involved in type VI secretion
VSPPAARIGDTTAHGGAIVAGEPTVLIGGAPAARLGDMHTCPIPGAPPPPHVGGPIILGCFTVLIGGKPAARVGDMCTCTGPPDSIVMGCTTVLIGEGGGGGGGMAGAGGKKVTGEKGAGAGKSKELAKDSGETDEAETENHYLDVKFVDKGGKPISGVAYHIKSPDNKTDKGTVFGKVKKTGVKEGDHEIELKGITKAQWSQKDAGVGDVVKMLVETSGFDDGTKATLEIWQQDLRQSPRVIRTYHDASVQGNKVTVEWEYGYEDQPDDTTSTQEVKKLSAPQYFFTVCIADCRAKSGMLKYRDWIEIKLKDQDGNPVANEAYVLRLSNGEVRQGKLDGNGYKKEEKVPPGEFQVEFPNLTDVGTED